MQLLNHLDKKFNEKPDYQTYLNEVIEELGGVKTLKPKLQLLLQSIPASKIREKIKSDIHLNNIPLKDWDRAAGFDTSNPYRCNAIGSPLTTMIQERFHTSISCAESVSILKEIARRCITTDEIRIETPEGDLIARTIDDDEYPGIAVLFSKEGNGEPGAILEYDSHQKLILLRIYDKTHPDDEPVKTYILN